MEKFVTNYADFFSHKPLPLNLAQHKKNPVFWKSVVCIAHLHIFSLANEKNKRISPKQQSYRRCDPAKYQIKCKTRLAKHHRVGDQFKKCLQHYSALQKHIRWEFLKCSGAVWPLFIWIGCELQSRHLWALVTLNAPASQTSFLQSTLGYWVLCLCWVFHCVLLQEIIVVSRQWRIK